MMIFSNVRVLKALMVMTGILFLFSCSGGEKEYYSNGEVMSMGVRLKDGRKDGPWEYWHDNGARMSKGSYDKGDKTGTWNYWNREDEAVAVRNYEGGVQVSETFVKKAESYEPAEKTRKKVRHSSDASFPCSCGDMSGRICCRMSVASCPQLSLS